MALLYRICLNIFIPQDPEGSLRFEGRWHHKGNAVLYFTSSLSTTVLEMLANGQKISDLRSHYHYTSVLVDTTKAESVPNTFSDDSANWKKAILQSRDLGSLWIKSKRSLLLAVRSAALTTETNYLINPSHADFAKLIFRQPMPIPLDPRIV
jgi:RES domain-containing protein